MITKKTGQLLQDFHILGHISSPVFLLDGKAPIIFEAGFTCLAKYIMADIKRVLKNRDPAYLFLTHIHYDHAGSVAYLKKN